jgi:NAD+ diphosphatase
MEDAATMMLQDIYPHSLHNQFTEKSDPLPESPVYVFRRADLLVVESREDARLEDIDQSGEHGKISMPGKDENEKGFYKERGRYLRLPTVKELGEDREYTFLFTMDGSAFFLLRDELDDADIPQGYQFKNIRTMRAEAYGPQHRLFAAITAYQLSNWYRDNRFCGTCGSRTVHSETERAVRCPSCGRMIYPRIIPAVIVGVINGDKILLTKYAGRDVPFYALIAGFTEIGETFEETVQREVMEEAGIRVKNIRYYKSQPWGIVDDLLAGFFCDVDGDPTIHMDKTELKEAGWHTRDEIVLQPTSHSLTNEMMTRFKKGLEC